MLKKLFGGKRKEPTPAEYTIEDLIVLEHYDEAAARLQAKLKKQPNDLHSHLKLADVYLHLREGGKALDEYVYVAEEYASDGFFEKGIALLSKVQKLFPTDETLPLKIEKIKQSKRMEHTREMAMEGLREGMKGTGEQAGTSALELQSMWGNLTRSTLVKRLSGDQLKQLFASMSLEHIDRNSVLAEDGAQLQELCLIVRGLVEARSGNTQLRTFSSGDIIGESALLQQKPWPALYRTAELTTVLRLNREGLERALVGNSDPRGLLDALREQGQDQQIAQLVQKLRS